MFYLLKKDSQIKLNLPTKFDIYIMKDVSQKTLKNTLAHDFRKSKFYIFSYLELEQPKKETLEKLDLHTRH